MRTEWRHVRLGDVADEVTVGHVGPMTSEYAQTGVPFLRSLNVRAHRIDLSDVRYISSEFDAKLKKSALRPGDVVTVRTGKPGTTAVVPDDLPVANCSDLVITRPGKDLDARWLSYFINGAAGGFISSRLVGAVQQHFNVGAAKDMTLLLPSIEEQQAISTVLGALDNKVIANGQLVARACSLGEGLLREHRLAPRPLADVATITMGSSPKGELLNNAGAGYPFHQGVRDFGALYPTARIHTEHPARTTRRKSVLLAVRAPVGKINIAIDDVAIGRGLAGLHSESQPATLFFALRAFGSIWDEFQGGGTVFASVTGPDVRAIALPMPSAEDSRPIEAQLSVLLERALAADRQSAVLTATRDELLPPLMSGRITVKDAERRVEEET